MKTTIVSFIVFLVLASASFAQPKFYKAGEGRAVTYDTSGTFAQPTLTGNKGILKYVGYIDMADGLMYADSVALHVSFQDSVRASFYFMPKSVYKVPTIADTVAAVLPAATATYYHSQDGAGQVVIPWFRLKAALTNLTAPAPQYDVYVKIWKIAGLHTYGLAASGKAVKSLNIVAVRQ